MKNTSDNLALIAITTCFTISFILLFTLCLLNTDTKYNFTYIDFNNTLGHSSLCKKNYCEVEDNKVIIVKEYIDNRK